MLGLTNFVFATINGNFTAVQVSLNVMTGQGARFTDLPARATLWNITNNSSAAQAFFAGQAEIVEISSEAADALTIIRDVEGTGAIANIPNEEYRISVTMTEDQWNLVMRARPSNGVPGTAEGFDAVRQGTPAAIAVADWLSREVFDDGVSEHGAIKSLQGGPREGNSTTLLLGDTAVPDNFIIKLLKFATTTDRLSILFKALPFITMEGRNRLGFFTATPGQADGLHIAATVRADKFVGLAEGIYTIDGAGAINDVNTPVIRVAAAGGPGSDDLDTINLESSSIPVGGRVMLFIEPTTTAHLITVRNGVGNIRLNSAGGDFLMDAQDKMLVTLARGTGNTTFFEHYRVLP